MARSKEFDEETVLEKAVQLFWCKGYNATSAQDLVDTLQISRSSMYDTFGDKRCLYLRALRHYREQMSGKMIALIESSQDAKVTIRQILEMAVKDSVRDKSSKGCFLVNTAVESAAHDKEIAEIVNGNRQDVEDALLLAIKKGQDNKQIPDVHSSRSLARFLFNTILGIRVAAKSQTDKTSYGDVIKVALSVLE